LKKKRTKGGKSTDARRTVKSRHSPDKAIRFFSSSGVCRWGATNGCERKRGRQVRASSKQRRRGKVAKSGFQGASTEGKGEKNLRK